MPPRKSVSVAAAGDAPLPAPLSPTSSKIPADSSVLTESGIPAQGSKERGPRQSTGKDQDGMGIDDLLLPRTLTSRLARGILPANTSIQKDALLALTKSATVFISYLASTANEQSTKKTIGPNDVLAALKEMELGQLMELDGREGGGRLERELEAWETVVKGKRKGYREKVKGRQSGVGADGEEGEERGEPETKRARVAEADEETMDTSMLNGDQRHNTNGNGESHHHPKTMFSDDDEPLEDTYQEDADATEDDGNAEDDEEEEPEDEQPDEDTLDNYGPDEQLRRDILLNGDDAGGTEDESD